MGIIGLFTGARKAKKFNTAAAVREGNLERKSWRGIPGAGGNRTKVEKPVASGLKLTPSLSYPDINSLPETKQSNSKQQEAASKTPHT